jgi:AcrR family transcriptional regulator
MSHAACRRQLILEAAERLLSHYGASKTTVADIAREAEVGVGTVYLEFPSKDAIVEALASERHARVLGAMREAASKRAPFASRLRLIFEARVKTQLALSRGGTHAGELVHCASPAMRQCGQRFVAEQTLLLVSSPSQSRSRGPCSDATRASLLPGSSTTPRPSSRPPSRPCTTWCSAACSSA